MKDSCLYSEQFGDFYFSRDGGPEETRHVFLAGNALDARFSQGGLFTIVELGFGTGLNFLLSWQAFRRHAANSGRLHVVSVEKHPFSKEDLAGIHAMWPEFGAQSQALLAGYPPLQAGFHRIRLDGGRVSLTLLFGDAAELLPQLEARANAFFLDGFAPSRNPQMWTPQIFSELARLAAPGATAATFSVAGSVRAGLSQAGFAVERRPGFARKREMLVARAQKTGSATTHPGSAIVIGAGIAGASCALALARRGVTVQVLDAGQQPGRGASGNPAALVRPFLGLDPGPRSRFTWSAFSFAARHYRAVDGLGDTWMQTGVLQLARDAAHARKQVLALERTPVPPRVCRTATAEEGTQLAGGRVDMPGLWLEEAGWVAGARMVRATLEAAGEAAASRMVSVSAIERQGERFLVRLAGGGVIESECVILANGHHAASLLPNNLLALRPVRGQATLLPPRAELRAPVCQEGYVTPVIGGTHVVGATYDAESDELTPKEEDDRTNLARARRMLPGAFAESEAVLGNWVGLRCVSADRRPVVGELYPNLYACLALGSRGFTWAPLAGELIASMIAGEPLPLERTIAEAISPLRFATRNR